ncbi:MAG: hypothetical protein J6S67_08040 [Methanobrevibacter sp.]|nr:hypothetical protein [Methanobrevibacter sp.]
MDGFTKIQLLQWRCFKVIPLVFDEALSYYEVLCKGASKTNELIEAVNTISDAIDAIVGDVEELQGKVEEIEGGNDKTGFVLFEGTIENGIVDVTLDTLKYKISDYQTVNVIVDHGTFDGAIVCSVTHTGGNNYAISGMGATVLTPPTRWQDNIYVHMTYNSSTNKITRQNSYRPDNYLDDPQGVTVEAQVKKITGVI